MKVREKNNTDMKRLEELDDGTVYKYTEGGWYYIAGNHKGCKTRAVMRLNDGMIVDHSLDLLVTPLPEAELLV